MMERVYLCNNCGNKLVTDRPFATASGSKGPVDVNVPYTCRNCDYQMIRLVTEQELAELDNEAQSSAPPDLPELPE